MVTRTGSSLRCRFCTKSFGSVTSREQHENSAAHPRFQCRQCTKFYMSKDDLDIHIWDHRAQSAQRQPVSEVVLSCDLCDVMCSSAFNYDQHIHGRKHRQVLASASTTSVVPSRIEIPPGSRPCQVCNNVVPSAIWDQHVNGARHTKLLGLQSLSREVDATEESKYGIQANRDTVDFGVLDVTNADAISSCETIRITNNGSQTIFLTRCTLSSRSRDSMYVLPKTFRVESTFDCGPIASRS
jgi:hypothetical protein